MHGQQLVDFGRIDHTFGLLQLAFCLLSIEGRRSPRWLAHKTELTLRTVSHYDTFHTLCPYTEIRQVSTMTKCYAFQTASSEARSS